MSREDSLSVRGMELSDISQVADIEREAFPEPWPPTDFKHELLYNRSCSYIVVSTLQRPEATEHSPPERTNHHRKSVFENLRSVLSNMLRWQKTPSADGQLILGYSGLWFMADEAHLANIAVRNGYRGKGLGELLVIRSFELAFARNSSLMTLEVRRSNFTAQALYRKYGFAPVGVRRGYYTDNREDALIMTVSGLQSESFKSSFQRLKQAYGEKWKRPV